MLDPFLVPKAGCQELLDLPMKLQPEGDQGLQHVSNLFSVPNAFKPQASSCGMGRMPLLSDLLSLSLKDV